LLLGVVFVAVETIDATGETIGVVAATTAGGGPVGEVSVRAYQLTRSTSVFSYLIMKGSFSSFPYFGLLW
jgi:hypothetical protein